MDSIAKKVGTILITGITASGKSTLAKRLEEDLIKSGINNVKRIEGEDFRKQLAKRGEYYGYSPDERKRLSPRFVEEALKYNRKGFICIMAGIYHMRAKREEVRRMLGNIMEVYLACPVNICSERDYKGHYAKAFKGLYANFIGVTEPYQVSDRAELVLYTGRDSINDCADILLEKTKKFLMVEKDKT